MLYFQRERERGINQHSKHAGKANSSRVLVIGVFGGELRFKPINKADAGTDDRLGASVAKLSRNLGPRNQGTHQKSVSSRVRRIARWRTFCNRRYFHGWLERLKSIVGSPVQVDRPQLDFSQMHTLCTGLRILPSNFLSPPNGDNELSPRNVMGSPSPRNQLSESISGKICFCLPSKWKFVSLCLFLASSLSLFLFVSLKLRRIQKVFKRCNS